MVGVLDQQPTLTVCEHPDGVQLWDRFRLVATLARNNALDVFVLTFKNGDPLGWGVRYLHTEEAANHLALAYVCELRARQSHRH
jgi:hypothetical protein